jgi:hypothetical protein
LLFAGQIRHEDLRGFEDRDRKRNLWPQG